MTSRLLVVAVAAVTLSLLPQAPAAHVPPCADTDPANDCMANATPLTSRRVDHIRVNNARAGIEAHEPGVGPDMQFTTWWKFTAFRDSTGALSVQDSNHQAAVIVWEQQADGSLLPIDSASGWSAWSWATFACTAGKTYYVQTGGEEGQSGIVDLWGDTCQLAVEPPRAPVISARPGDARGEIALSWYADDGGAPVTDREIQRSTGTCTAFEQIRPDDPTDTPTDAGLAEATVYCYRVRLTNSAGWGPWSNLAASVPRGVAPATWSFVATPTSASRIALAWNVPSFDGGSPIAGYRVYGAADASGPFALLGEVTGTTTAETGLAPGTQRHYRVATLNEYGEGPYRAAAARTWGPPTAPRAVDTGPAFPDPLGVEVTWSPPADNGGRPILDYTVFRGPKGGELRPIAVVPGSQTSFVDDPPLLRGFDYAVTARNAIGESPLSGRACGEAFPAPPPFEGC